jgi:hypothetical protein
MCHGYEPSPIPCDLSRASLAYPAITSTAASHLASSSA